MMKKTILTWLSLLAVLICPAQPVTGYKPLDPGNPIEFGGDYIIYKGQSIKLGPRAFFIDGQFSDMKHQNIRMYSTVLTKQLNT